MKKTKKKKMKFLNRQKREPNKIIANKYCFRAVQSEILALLRFVIASFYRTDKIVVACAALRHKLKISDSYPRCRAIGKEKCYGPKTKDFCVACRKCEFKHGALLRAVITLRYEKPLVNSSPRARRLDVKAERAVHHGRCLPEKSRKVAFQTGPRFLHTRFTKNNYKQGLFETIHAHVPSCYTLWIIMIFAHILRFTLTTCLCALKQNCIDLCEA